MRQAVVIPAQAASADTISKSAISADTQRAASSVADPTPNWLAFLAASGIHPKLSVSSPGDADEREADAVADRVMRMAAPVSVGRSESQIHRKCAACAEEDRDVIARKSNGMSKNTVQPNTAALVNLGTGARLPSQERAFFEQRFGRDLGNIRIHTGSQAHSAATSINAYAFTHRHNIAFADGRYAPGSFAGRKLLAHEIAHVVQNDAGAEQVRRKACGHDSSKGPGCGGGALARWNLVNIATQVVENIALDDKIIREGLQGRFGTNWVAQITTPPNPVKGGDDRGRIDGARVSGAGDLKIEIVEVKSRSTTFAGGCALATREAQGYVDVLKPLGPKIIEISTKLAPVGGLRVALGKKPLAADLMVLTSVGIDLNDPVTKQAWTFYNGLQNRLDRTFANAFTGFVPQLFADGTPGDDYDVGLPVAVTCKKKGKPGIKPRQLKFQVNGKGGVSYRCEDGPCKTKEEEDEEKRQVQPQPQQQPVAQPQAQPQGQPQGKIDDVPGENEKDKPQTEDPWISNPIVLTGAATGTALTAAAIALARARAKRIAEERIAKELLERAVAKAAQEQAKRAAAKNVINLAERRMAKEAAEQGIERGAGRLAGKAVGKALIYAEVAAIVLVVFSGKAEAKVGFGPSAFEALYDIMRQNGHEPSPEMKALIESDPVLKKLAEQAGSGGDPTALQEEATKRMMALVRDNPGEFTAEELEVLRQASNAGVGSGSPATTAELRAAIDRAVAMQGKQPSPGGASDNKSPGGGGVTDSTAPGGGSASPGSTTSTGSDSTGVSSGDLQGETEAIVKKYPGLSPAMQGSLAASPPAVRAVFDAMTGPGKGLAVDDAMIGDFLSSIPPDLTAVERDKLIANIKPIADADAAAVMESLRAAVTAIRTPTAKPVANGSDNPQAQPSAESDAVKDESSPAANKDTVNQAAGNAQGDKKTPEEAADDAARERIIATLRAALESYGGWGDIQPGQANFVGKITSVKVGDEIGLYHYIRSTNSVRFVAYVQFRVITPASKTGDQWSATVVSSTDYVSENGAVVPEARLPAGRTVRGTLK